MPVDIGSIKRNDQIAGAAAVLALILSLIPGARTFEAKAGAGLGNASESVNLWHGLGVLAALLLIVGVAGVVVTVLEVSELQALPVRWITTGVLGLATLLSLIYIFTYDGGVNAPPGVDVSEFIDMAAGWAGYLLVLLGIVATVFAAMGAVESGEQLPGRKATAGGEATPPPAA
ncbi:MAG TPA: hypothetical protein VEX15_10350 [Nocardioidaceae bacterium]|nr:hypothetical protein [Nocardioidaceae bacterium]